MMATDLGVVVAPQNADWILGAIGRQVVQHSRHRARLEQPMRRRRGRGAEVLLLTHWSMLRRRSPTPAVVLLTHLELEEQARRLARRIQRSKTICVSMSSHFADVIVHAGAPADRVRVAIPGAPPAGLSATAGAARRGLLLASAYYPRKNPALILDVIERLPSEQFTLLGRGWDRSPYADRLAACQNLVLAELPWIEQAAVFAEAELFLSLSRLEGGPMPLLDAMAGGARPVVTTTGFARDLVADGVSGILLPVDATVGDVIVGIERARALTGDPRTAVAHLTWERFVSTIDDAVDEVITSS